jgi:hypothetical protein
MTSLPIYKLFPCSTCGAPCNTAKSRSEKNSGRTYYKCPKKTDKDSELHWTGWVDDYFEEFTEEQKAYFTDRGYVALPETKPKERPIKRPADDSNAGPSAKKFASSAPSFIPGPNVIPNSSTLIEKLDDIKGFLVRLRKDMRLDDDEKEAEKEEAAKDATPVVEEKKE